MPSEAQEKAKDLIYPALVNAWESEAYMMAWVTIAERATDINAYDKHRIFFGSVQCAFLDSTVLKLCKLYENSDIGRNASHSLIHIIQKLQSLSPAMEISFVESEHKMLFGEKPLSKDVSDFLNLLSIEMPTSPSDKNLKQLFTYRDKVVAHQELLSTAKKNSVSWLPSDGDIIGLCKWAENVCQALMKLYWGARVIPRVQSLEVATENVIEKALSD